MKCLVCGSDKILIRKTKISDFLIERIFGKDQLSQDYSVNLCHCENCSFSFYDRRLTDEESDRLYNGYRGEEYQRIREKHDCWYTKRINDALNNDSVALKEQQRVIENVVKENVSGELRIALDYGGNQGATFTDRIGTHKKFVYDISDVETYGGGVEKIKDYNKLFEYQYDFIMCNMTLEHVSYPKEFMKLLYNIGSMDTYFYLEVPSENPFKDNKFSIMQNLTLLINPVCSNIRLIRHFIHLKDQPYMPMAEHVNFYTPKALKTLVQNCGFKVIDVQENYEKGVLGKTKVLSVICKKREI